MMKRLHFDMDNILVDFASGIAKLDAKTASKYEGRLDDVFHKCLILLHNKDLLKGDYLIDDRLKHGADTFDGERIQFYSKHFPDWAPVVEYLSPK